MTGMLEWKDTGSLGGTGREMKQPCCPVCQGQLERMELLLGMDETLTESLGVRIKEKAGYSDSIKGSFTGCPARKIDEASTDGAAS